MEKTWLLPCLETIKKRRAPLLSPGQRTRMKWLLHCLQTLRQTLAHPALLHQWMMKETQQLLPWLGTLGTR